MLGRLTSKSLHIALIIWRGLSFYTRRSVLHLPQPYDRAILNSGSIFPAAFSCTG